MISRFRYYIFIVLTLSVCTVSAARLEYTLEIRDHLFYPAEIEIPAHTKVKLIIYNRDRTPEEFDSFDLNREKVMFPQKKAVIFIGPLPKGNYHFFGEYNPNSARGTIVVIEQVRNSKMKDSANVN